jgi:hypothetical protein
VGEGEKSLDTAVLGGRLESGTVVVNCACEPSQRLTRHAKSHVRESLLHDRPRVLESAGEFQKDSLESLHPYANQDSKIYIREVFYQASTVGGYTPNDMSARSSIG